MDIIGKNAGGCYAFTLNLSPALVLRAAGKKDFLQHIRKAVARELGRELPRKVDFWFALEATIIDEYDKRSNAIIHERIRNGELDPMWRKLIKNRPSGRHGRPHLHGVLAISPDEIPAAQKTLRIVNGKTSAKFMNQEVRFEPVTYGVGWAEYATEYTGLTRLFMPGTNILTCTNGVTRLAKELYEADRQFIINSRCS